ncbi:MAG: hypothetical protein HF970_05460 [ANME-2 cluster archaeon]|nr:hypothetical protein [ANME-2 cluster archaeon]
MNTTSFRQPACQEFDFRCTKPAGDTYSITDVRAACTTTPAASASSTIPAIEPAAHLYIHAHAACVWSEHRKRGRCGVRIGSVHESRA